MVWTASRSCARALNSNVVRILARCRCGGMAAAAARVGIAHSNALPPASAASKKQNPPSHPSITVRYFATGYPLFFLLWQCSLLFCFDFCLVFNYTTFSFRIRFGACRVEPETKATIIPVAAPTPPRTRSVGLKSLIK